MQQEAVMIFWVRDCCQLRDPDQERPGQPAHFVREERE